MSKLRSDLTRIAINAPELASKALLQTGQDVYEVSQQLVPRDTTSLALSGGVEVIDSGTVQVGYGVPGEFISGREPSKYAGYVEFGTSRSEAQPFLVPAFTQNEETFKQRLGQAIIGEITG